MMQGDSYGIPIVLRDKDSGVVIRPEDVLDIEVAYGHIIKYHSKEEVVFDEDSQNWVFFVTQEETFGLPVSQVKIIVRIHWPNGYVQGIEAGEEDVKGSTSKEVFR